MFLVTLRKSTYRVRVGTRWLTGGSALGILLVDSAVLLSRAVGALISLNTLLLGISEESLSTLAANHALHGANLLSRC